MSSPLTRGRRALSIAVGLLACLLLAVGCGGGGGGGGDDGGDDDGGSDLGASGVGADGVPIFGWKYSFGDFGAANSVLQNPDGSFVLAGVRQPDQQPAHLYLTKVNATGGTLWERSYLGPDGGAAIANGVRRTADGGLLVAGEAVVGGMPRFYLLKADADGNAVGARSYEGSIGDAGFPAALQTADGGYVAVGTKQNGSGWLDAYLMKARPDGPGGSPGSIDWERYFGGNGPDWGYALAPTADGGVAVAGVWDNGPSPSLYLVKTDAGGNEEWSRHSYGVGRALAVVQAADGGFVLAGAVPDGGGRDDLLVLRTDPAGEEIRRRVFGGARDDLARSIARTADGGYVVAGSTRSYSSGTDPDGSPWQTEDLYLIKLDGDLDTVWQTVKGRAPDSGDAGMAVLPTADGGYVVSGSLGGSVALVKFDRNGDTVVLGQTDFTLHPTEQAGTITMANAEEAAGAAATAFDLVRLVGDFAVGRLIGVLKGEMPAQFCTGGGTYSYTLTPGPPTAGSSFSVTFDACVADLGGAVTFEGTVGLDVALLTGSLLTSGYVIDSTVHAVDFVFTDDVGPKAVAGDLRFRRTSSAAGTEDRADSLEGRTLTLAAEDGTTEVGPFSVSAAQTPTLFTLGPATATVTRSGIGVLVASVEASAKVQGPTARTPVAGTVRASALDQTSVEAVVGAGGAVRLDVDTDGNGSVDGTQSTSWDALLY